jgi:hypothetical protein
MNPDGSIAFALTSWAIYACHEPGAEYRRLRPSEIREARLAPNEGKHLADTLILETTSGDAIKIRIDGGDGRYRDIHEVYRFFMRAQEDATRFGEA